MQRRFSIGIVCRSGGDPDRGKNIACDSSHRTHRREGIKEGMKRLMILAVATVPFGILPLIAQPNQSPQSNPPPAKKAPAANSDRGQQVFEQNCSRCHNPPGGFSPRISGAIALHMRVRANLSDADYKALLRFFNP
jgi:mono/diheme cytochrome c family protein